MTHLQGKNSRRVHRKKVLVAVEAEELEFDGGIHIAINQHDRQEREQQQQAPGAKKRKSHFRLAELNPVRQQNRLKKITEEHSRMTVCDFHYAIRYLGWKGRATGWKGLVNGLREDELYTDEDRQNLVPPDPPRFRPDSSRSISSWDKEESTWEEASYTGNQFPPYAPPVGDWVWCISSQLYWSPGTREYLHPLNSEGLGFRFCTITKRWRHPNGYWEKNAPHEVWMNVRLTVKVESERAGRMMEPNVDILAVLGILPEAPKNMTGGHLAINHLNNSFSFPVWETEDHHYYDYLSGFWCGPGKEGWKILSSASRQIRFGANIVLLPHGNEDALQEE